MFKYDLALGGFWENRLHRERAALRGGVKSLQELGGAFSDPPLDISFSGVGCRMVLISFQIWKSSWEPTLVKGGLHIHVAFTVCRYGSKEGGEVKEVVAHKRRHRQKMKVSINFQPLADEKLFPLSTPARPPASHRSITWPLLSMQQSTGHGLPSRVLPDHV